VTVFGRNYIRSFRSVADEGHFEVAPEAAVTQMYLLETCETAGQAAAALYEAKQYYTFVPCPT
jgi:hypothetical protein